MADNDLETQLRAKALTIHDRKLLDYMRERDTRRRHNIITFLVVAFIAVIVGWTVLNVRQAVTDQHQRQQDRVHDIGCSMDSRLC